MVALREVIGDSSLSSSVLEKLLRQSKGNIAVARHPHHPPIKCGFGFIQTSPQGLNRWFEPLNEGFEV